MFKNTRRNKNKKRGSDKPGPQTNARTMEDVENPHSGFKDQKTPLWKYIRHPSMVIDAITSGIIWIQIFVYQKFAGRMPLFIRSKADDQEEVVKIHKTRIAYLDKERATLSERNENLSVENLQGKEIINDLKEKNEKVEEEKEKKNLELRDSIIQFEQQSQTLEGVEKKLKEMIKENHRLQENNNVLSSDKKKLEQSNKDEKVKNERLENQNAILCVEKDNQKCQNDELRKEVLKRVKEIQNFEVTIKKQEKLINEAEYRIKSMQQEIDTLENKLGDGERVIQELCGNMNKLTEQKKILEGDKQDALRRLSEQVSVKRRDNNPNIVDLSDPCDATKLAEMFSELYDNEWTNAFSVLLEDEISEEQAIIVLLDTVMLAYSFCEQKVEEPWKTLEDWFLDKNLPGNQQTSKWLKDSRKVNIQKKVPEIEKIFYKNVLRICDDGTLKSLLTDDKELSIYFTKCIEVCLLMVATDPPVVLVCPGWNVIQIEALTCRVHEEEGDHHNSPRDDSENSNYIDECSEVEQNTPDKTSVLSQKNNEIKEITTQLDRRHDLMNASVSIDTTVIGNTKEKKAETLQNNQDQPDYGPQGNDNELENGENGCDKTTNAVPDETQLNEDNGASKSKNMMSKQERDSSKQQGNDTELDNSELFDSDDQPKTQQHEPSFQTADNSNEVGSSEITTTTDKRMDDEKLESIDRNGYVLKENVNTEINKTQSEEQNGVTHAGQDINESESLLPQASNANNSSDDKTINIISDKRNDDSNGDLNENTNVEVMKFDKDLFKEYTRRGEFQEYVIWPALRLHEGGPLLSKGVAQGSKRKNQNKNNDTTWTWTRRQ